MAHDHEPGIRSRPPAAGKRIKEIWWDPDTEEVVLIIKD